MTEDETAGVKVISLKGLERKVSLWM